MNNKFLHFHIIPTTFCSENCPYCINSNKNFNEINFETYKLFLKKIKELSKDYNIILEFNGGEFTLSKNLFKYFKELDKSNINLYKLILTTNFNSNNNIYKDILKLIDKFNTEFFVTFHYNKTKNFLTKIKSFLKDTKDFDYIFTINLIKGLPLIEKNWLKYFEEISSIKDCRVKINYSKYIQKSNINAGKTFNFENKKICKGGIYYFTDNKIMDACRSKSYDIQNFKPNFELIYCNKTCPNQDFSLEIFKPKILSKILNKRRNHERS